MQLDPITRAVLDAMQEGVLIIDAQERIVYGNRAYVAFLEKEAGGPIGPIEGYPLRLLRPGARLPEVLAQKRPILHTPRQESEDIYFVNMYPIFDGAEVVGGLSVVTFWKDAFDFRAELERYEKRSRQVLRRVNKANAAHYTFDSIVAVSPRSAACRELASRPGPDRRHRPAPVGERHGKGAVRPGHPQRQPPLRRGVRGHQLRQLQRQYAGVRALRLYRGGLYWRQAGREDRPL